MVKQLILASGILALLSGYAQAQSQLEVPGPGSKQSGIGIVSGWKCTAGTITIQFDNDGSIYTAAYGTIREDTQGVCGDTNNGWAFLWNWNRLGDGQHTVAVFDNGVQFGAATFTVQTLGQEFRTDLSKSTTISDFPEAGQTTTLTWEQGQQNFVIAEVIDNGGGGETDLNALLGTWDFQTTILSTIFHNHYALQSVQVVQGVSVIAGTDLDEGDPIVAARTSDLTSAQFPYTFALLDSGATFCDLFVFDKTGPDTITGVDVMLEVQGGACSTQISGEAHSMVGTRTSTTALALAMHPTSHQLRETLKLHADTLARQQGDQAVTLEAAGLDSSLIHQLMQKLQAIR
jgi:hypothetical protein